MDELSPESDLGSCVGILWQERRAIVLPHFIDVFKNDKGFRDGFSIVDEHRNFLVNGIEFEELWGFVIEIFFHILKRDAFEFECKLDPSHERANPESMKHHSVFLCH